MHIICIHIFCLILRFKKYRKYRKFFIKVSYTYFSRTFQICFLLLIHQSIMLKYVYFSSIQNMDICLDIKCTAWYSRGYKTCIGKDCEGGGAMEAKPLPPGSVKSIVSRSFQAPTGAERPLGRKSKRPPGQFLCTPHLVHGFSSPVYAPPCTWFL